jgi:hypothetical protein
VCVCVCVLGFIYFRAHQPHMLSILVLSIRHTHVLDFLLFLSRPPFLLHSDVLHFVPPAIKLIRSLRQREATMCV